MVFPSVLIPGVFEAFDENRDGKFGEEIISMIDFRL